MKLAALLSAGLCALAILGTATAAQAAATWDITNGQLTNGDTINGQINIDVYGYLNGVNEIDLTESSPPATDVFGGPSPAVAPSINNPTDTIEILYDGGYNDFLYLVFSNTLQYGGVNSLVTDESYWCDTWSCNGTFSDPSAGQVFFALSSPPAVTAVPEPATWMMLLFGFGALGFTLRTSRLNRAVAPV